MHARAIAPRLFVVSLVMAALLVLVIGQTHTSAVQRAQGGVIAVLSPVLQVLGQPVAAIRGAVEATDNLIGAHRDNARLREEVARLQQWQMVARQLEQENASYRALLNVRREPQPVFVTARVIADAGGPFVRTMLVNAGRRDGVEKGQPVISGEGVVGRIVETAERAARILLLTDLNSRIPVTVEHSRYRAVLAGDNSDMLKLVFLPTAARVQIGDRIVTSGHGGVFPPGLAVGVVTSAGDGDVRVVPMADLDRLEYVNVVRYELGRIVAGEDERPGSG